MIVPFFFKAFTVLTGNKLDFPRKYGKRSINILL